MSELDEEWQRRFDEAMRRAAAVGRGDVADYVRLRQANDEARGVAIRWLIDLFTVNIGAAVRAGASVSAERNEAHRFTSGGATMVGVSLAFRRGVRSLTIEAGYPRTPQDGFVAGGGLARGSIHHFGDARARVELLLVRSAANELDWYELRDQKRERRFIEGAAQAHVHKLLG